MMKPNSRVEMFFFWKIVFFLLIVWFVEIIKHMLVVIYEFLLNSLIIMQVLFKSRHPNDIARNL